MLNDQLAAAEAIPDMDQYALYLATWIQYTSNDLFFCTDYLQEVVEHFYLRYTLFEGGFADFIIGFFVYLGSKVGFLTIYIQRMQTTPFDAELYWTNLGYIIYTLYNFEPTEEAGYLENEQKQAVKKWLESIKVPRLRVLPEYSEVFSVLGIFNSLIGLMHGVGFLNTANGNDC